MRKLLLVALTAMLAATLAAIGSLSRDAIAGHDTHVTSELPVVLARERANQDGDARPSVNGVPAIARNPIAIAQLDRGKPKWRIRVCSVPAYDDEVSDAVDVWNTGLGITLFEMLAGDPNPRYDARGDVDDPGGIRGTDCPETAPTENDVDKYIASVVVIENRNPMRQDSTGWAQTLRMNNEHFARTGRNRIYVNDAHYDRLKSEPGRQVAFFVHELGHTLGFSHPYGPMSYAVPGYTHPTNVGGLYPLVGCPEEFRVVVDETRDGGGTITPVNRSFPVKLLRQTPPRWGFTYQDDSGPPGSRSVFLSEGHSRVLSALSKTTHGGANMISLPNCWGDTESATSPGEWYFDRPVSLSQYTKDVYTKVYNPAKVTDLTVTELPENKLLFKWKPDHVHVERTFAVQVQVTTGWATVVEAFDDKKAIETSKEVVSSKGNTATHRIVDPSGAATMTFRVFSRTEAFGSNQPSVNDPPVAGTIGTPGPVNFGTNAQPPVPPRPQCTLSVAPAESDKATHGGWASGAWSGDCDAGTLRSVTATPIAGYRFSHWEGDCSGTGACRVTMDEDRSVTASFSKELTATATARSSSTASQAAANSAAEAAARAALVAAYPTVTGISVTHVELPETTVTDTGTVTGSGTGANKPAAESAALSNAEAAARADGGPDATIGPASVTDTTPPDTRTETGTGHGSGTGANKPAAESAALSNAEAAARADGGPDATIGPASVTDTTPPDTRTETGSESRAGLGSTSKQAASSALSNASAAARAAGGASATITGSTVSTPTASYRTGTTTVTAGYTDDTETAAWLGCAGRLVSAARAVSGYVRHSGGCSVSADIGAKGETIYVASGSATVTWRLIAGWTATATVSWSRTVTDGPWSAEAEASWSRTVTDGPWRAEAEASWSRTVTTYHARGTATGTVPP